MNEKLSLGFALFFGSLFFIGFYVLAQETPIWILLASILVTCVGVLGLIFHVDYQSKQQEEQEQYYLIYHRITEEPIGITTNTAGLGQYEELITITQEGFELCNENLNNLSEVYHNNKYWRY